MKTFRIDRPIAGAKIVPRSLDAERVMAWLVLLTIALSVLVSVDGHAGVEGKVKNGVRRAASQLERKIVNVPMMRERQVPAG